MIPAVRNLIFAYASRTNIYNAKSRVPYLQYITRRNGDRNEPLIVPERQMQQFIAIAENYSENLIYVSSAEIDLKKETKVRVIGGVLDGIEGSFIKIKGIRNKRLVVIIPNTLAAIIEVEPEYLMILKD